MKKLVAGLWFINVILPAFHFMMPSPELVCAVCEATGHELCALEGHHCSHLQPKIETASCCVSRQSDPSHCTTPAKPATGPTMGHKCAQPDSTFIFNDGMRYLPLGSEGSLISPHSEIVRITPMLIYPLHFHKQIDRPPINTLS